MLGSYTELNVISAFFILASAAVPIYLTVKLKGATRRLAFLFAVFIMVHAAYHLVVIAGFEFIGEGALEPLSVVVLLLLGLYYLKVTSRNVGRRV